MAECLRTRLCRGWSVVAAMALGIILGPAESTDSYLGASIRVEPAWSNGCYVLSWPSPAPGLQLQSATELGTTPNWTTVAEPIFDTGARMTVSLKPQAGRQFFRLASPLHHVLVGGQSLGMGAFAGAVLSTNQPFQNKMFVGQRLDGNGTYAEADDLSAFQPLREQLVPDQFAGETIASGFANWIAAKAGPGVHDLLVSNCARGGATYAEIQRLPSETPDEEPSGTIPYLRGIAQVESARKLAGPGLYRCEAILIVHGEADSFNPYYDLNVRSWQADYEADIHRLTGQDEIIPMFHTQISSWSNLNFTRKSLSPNFVLLESMRSPERTVLVGPKYIFPYADDGLHLTAESYRWLGEYYAKAYYQHVVEKKPWHPVRPMLESFVRTNNVIDMTFTGVVGRLVFDTELVDDPGGTEIFDPTGDLSGQPAVITVGPYGFEYIDRFGEGTPWRCATTITSVDITGRDTIRITLSRTPPNDDFRIRYAYTALNHVQGGHSGPQLGARGCLRDTDPAVSRHGHTLYNWCVHFDLPYLRRP